MGYSFGSGLMGSDDIYPEKSVLSTREANLVNQKL